jgi:hypothetical protein
LDYLLNHTYSQIIEAATDVETLIVNISSAGVYLSNAIEICCLCLKLAVNMSET